MKHQCTYIRCAFYIYRINTCVLEKIRYNHMAYEFVASIVQRLECKPSKLEMRVRFPLLAPRILVIARNAHDYENPVSCHSSTNSWNKNSRFKGQQRRTGTRPVCINTVATVVKFWACAGVGEPGQTVNLLSYD